MPTNPEKKPPIEIAPADPAPLRDGGTGVDYVHRFESGRPGPRVAIAGLTHGNEACGLTAIRWLLDEGVQPVCGTLTLWLGNVDACRRVDPARPETRFGVRAIDRDLNRCWADALLTGDDPAVELRRARELLPFVDDADALLDIHSTTYAARPFFAFRDTARNRALADALGFPWSHLLIDGERATGMPMIERPRFADPGGHACALVVECGAHYARATGETAIQVVLRFLDHFGMVERDFVRRHRRVTPSERTTRYRIHEVYRATTDEASFVRPFTGFEEVRAGETILVDGGREIVAPFDRCAVLMPWPVAGRGRELVTLARIVD
jgi:predicted deacylase